MREFRLQSGLTRAVLDGFALPLGLVPGDVEPPTVGYTLDYTPGEDDEPDTYTFYAVISHEHLSALADRAISLLPDEVFGIIEIGSRDAYRALDVYMAMEPLPKSRFYREWKQFEAFLLEDGLIGCGANGEEPFVEVFLDQWKGLSIHVPLGMREEVEVLLEGFGLHEVTETWPAMDERRANAALRVRPVLAVDDPYLPDVDGMLLHMRNAWGLELNIDPDSNVDDSGRELGNTLWHAMVVVTRVDDREKAAYASIWATAGSLTQMERLIEDALDGSPQWQFEEIYTVDRVAYDERPDELADLGPTPQGAEVHLVVFEP